MADTRFKNGDKVVVKSIDSDDVAAGIKVGMRGVVKEAFSRTTHVQLDDLQGPYTFYYDQLEPAPQRDRETARQRIHHDEDRKQAALKVWCENQHFGISKSDVARLFGIKQSTFNMWTLELQVDQTSENTVKVRCGFPVGSTVEDLLAAMLDVLQEIKENTKRRTN